MMNLLNKEVRRMAAQGEVYRCTLCGHVVEVKQEGEGDLTCCGMPMEELSEREAQTFRES
jgi:superoxide reductase